MRLKELRKKNKITQEELATIIKIKKQTYQNYELSKRQPDIETLKDIADYYNISLDYLCKRDRNYVVDLSEYSDTGRELIKKIRLLNPSNLEKLNSVCDGLLLGQ